VSLEPDPLLPDEEAEWIRAAQAGDRSCFARLVDRYWDRLYRWLYHLTRDRHTAEDLAQETFLKALAGLA
jgi:RNA polymerase sigma-70 factor (ECF subfamily)